MKIEMNVSTRVNLNAGTVVEVSDTEAARLLLLGWAKEVTATPKKKTTK